MAMFLHRLPMDPAMSTAAADRLTIRRMIACSGYRPSTAAYEMASRGRDRAEMDALAAEVMAELRRAGSLCRVDGRVG